MNHIQIINHLIKKYGYKNYLEIGVHTKSVCFDHIKAEHKTGVDPGYENPDESVDYPIESDDFFDALRAGLTEFPPDYRWDIIFIDGLHLAPQVERDVLNSLRHLSENGTVVMHDCNPTAEVIAREEYKNPSRKNLVFNGTTWYDEMCWCGTTWKAFYKFRASVPDISMWCVEDDFGVGIIRFGKQTLAPFNNPYYEYKVMDANRKEHLNLITSEQFLNMFPL
jgi:hypothetical protein